MSIYQNIDTVVHVQINLIYVDSKVIRYRRDQNICSGIANLELVMRQVDSDVYFPWDRVSIYEGGGRVGIFYVSTVTIDANNGTCTLNCQDTSKKLTDYFISDSYTIEEFSTTTEWIPIFLNEAGVSYQMGNIESAPLSTNSQLGLMSAYDQIVQLLQYSGAYMYFDENGVCIIGSLQTRAGGVLELEDDTITSLKHILHDTMLRNRAVVWGNADPETGDWIIADLHTITAYNYDSRDLRAVVLSNHNIASVEDAQVMARRLLNEFARINNEFEIGVAGMVDAKVGRYVTTRSNFGRATGTITTITHEMSEKGMTTLIILNERCPRLFAFWDEELPGDTYVYVGTAGEGVWRKPIGGASWEDFNQAVTMSGSGAFSNKNITDLYIYSDEFVCVESGGESFYRPIDGVWSVLAYSGLPNASTSGTVEFGGAFAKACTINHNTSELIVGYNHPIQFSGAWVVTFSGLYQNTAYQAYVQSGVLASGGNDEKQYGITILDIDTADAYNVLTVVTTGGSGVVEVVPSGSGGYDVGQQWRHPNYIDPSSVVIVPKPEDVTVVNFEDYYVSAGISVLIGSPSIIYGTITTVNKSDDRIYVYWLQATYSGGWTISAKRRKYDKVNDSWSTDTVVMNDWVGEIENLIYSNKYPVIYKDDNDDDIVYIVNIQAAPDVTFVESHKVNFDTGSTELIVYYNLDCPIRPGGGSNSTQTTISGDKVYSIYIERDGNTDLFGLQIVNIKTGDTELRTFQTRDWTQYGSNAIYTFGTFSCAITPRLQGGVLFAFSYVCYPFLGGYAHGTDMSFSMEDLITLTPSSDPDDPHIHPGGGSSLGMFTGHQEDTTNMLYHISIRVNENGIQSPELSINNFIRIYAGANLPELTTRTSSSGEDGEISSYSKPLSCKYRKPEKYLALDHDTLEFRSIIDGGVLHSTDLSGYFGDKFLYDSRIDDINDLIYVAYGDGFLGISLNGNIVAEYNGFPSAYAGNNTRLLYFADLFIVHKTFNLSFSSATMFINLLIPTFSGWQDRPEDITNKYYVLKQSSEVFETVKEISGSYVLDISNGTPSEIFVRSSGDDTTGDVIFQSFENNVDTFLEIEPTYPTYDIRTVRFASLSGQIASGIMNSQDGQYALVGTRDAIKGYPTSLSGSSITYANFSGSVVQIETTRLSTDPYIFGAISGSVTSGVSGWLFVQRNPGATNVFTSYSVPGEVTVIRMDDQF